MDAGIAHGYVSVGILSTACLLSHTFILTWHMLPRAFPGVTAGSVVHSFLILLTG